VSAKPIEWLPHTVHVAVVMPPGAPGVIKECLQFTLSGDDGNPPTWVPAAIRLGPLGVIEQVPLGSFASRRLAEEASQKFADTWYDDLCSLKEQA